MDTLLVSILALAITSGQLIKIPIISQGTITVLDIVVLIFCLAGLIKIRFKLQKPPSQIMAVILFISAATASLAFSPLSLNLNEYLVSFFYILRFSLYVLFAWIITLAFPNIQNNLKKVLLISGISFAVLGLIQFILLPDLYFLHTLGWDPHYFRTVSTFLDPNFTGAFLVLTLLLLIYLKNQSLVSSKLFYLFFILSFIALLTTFSRSSYLMFLFSGLAYSLMKKSKIFFLITLVLFLTLLFSFKSYTRQVAGPKNIDREASASFRLNTWQQGFYLFKNSPILGIGFNSYRYGLKEYKLGDNQFLQSHGSTSNDSSLLFVAATTGIIGLIAYFYFLLSLSFISFPNRLLILPAVTGLLIHSIFANSLFYPPILAWLLLISVSSRK